MKKILKRIIGIIFLLVLGYYKLCYAEVVEIAVSPLETLFWRATYLLGFVSIIFFIMSTISYFKLNKMEKSNEIDEKKKKIKKILYTLLVLLSLDALIFIGVYGGISDDIYRILACLLLLALFICKLDSNKKFFSITFVGIIAILGMICLRTFMIIML